MKVGINMLDILLYKKVKLKFGSNAIEAHSKDIYCYILISRKRSKKFIEQLESVEVAVNLLDYKIDYKMDDTRITYNIFNEQYKLHISVEYIINYKNILKSVVVNLPQNYTNSKSFKLSKLNDFFVYLKENI